MNNIFDDSGAYAGSLVQWAAGISNVNNMTALSPENNDLLNKLWQLEEEGTAGEELVNYINDNKIKQRI